MNQAILDWQNSFQAFGIPYTGPKNGEINSAFLIAVNALESKFNSPGQILSGFSIKLPVNKAKEKFLTQQTPPKELAPKEEAKLKEEPKKEEQSKDQEWKQFLSISLSSIGLKSTNDLKQDAKSLENFISDKIKKSVSGMIYNQQTNSFNTSMDDVKSALTLIKEKETTQKTARDNRYFEFAKYFENS